MSSSITHLSCLSSIINKRRLDLHFRSNARAASFRTGKVLSVMSNNGHGTGVSNLDKETSSSYVENESKLHNGTSIEPHPPTEGFVVGESKEHLQEQAISQPNGAAKIHDFCFGIPFGGLVFCGGLVGFIFTRSPVTLATGVLFGGSLFALSTFSLMVWRQGKSSLPFILGQAALSVALLWKNIQAFSLTKKLIPSGFYAVISAAMLCFYSYVVISGGNPPPKKLKPLAAQLS